MGATAGASPPTCGWSGCSGGGGVGVIVGFSSATAAAGVNVGSSVMGVGVDVYVGSTGNGVSVGGGISVGVGSSCFSPPNGRQAVMPRIKASILTRIQHLERVCLIAIVNLHHTGVVQGCGRTLRQYASILRHRVVTGYNDSGLVLMSTKCPGFAAKYLDSWVSTYAQSREALSPNCTRLCHVHVYDITIFDFWQAPIFHNEDVGEELASPTLDGVLVNRVGESGYASIGALKS
jgi:hypothetical protein